MALVQSTFIKLKHYLGEYMSWKNILKTDEELEKLFGMKKKVQFAEGAQDHYNYTLQGLAQDKKQLMIKEVANEWNNQKQPITSEAINRLKNAVMATGSMSRLPSRSGR